MMSIPIRRVLVVALCLLLMVAGAVTMTQRAGAVSATPVVYVATGENFPDALGAGPAAAIVKGPILLVSRDSVPTETAAELTRLSPGKIIIVGGTAVVSENVAQELSNYATVERIAGANRYDTAAKLSEATYPATIDADTVGGKTADALTSDVYSTYRDAGINIPTSYGQVFELTNLPKGNYLVIAKTYFRSSVQQGVECRLYAGGQWDQVRATLEGSHYVPGTFTVVAQITDGVASLRCDAFATTGATINHTKITAISVDGLRNLSG